MKRIMVVDDCSSTLTQLVNILERNGYATVHTDDPSEAPMMLLTEAPNALIVELEMPGFSGAELIQLVRTWPQFHDIPILALARGVGREEITKALLAGANDVLPKPVQEVQLLEHVASRFWHQGPRVAVSNGTDVIPRMVTAGLVRRKGPSASGSANAVVTAAKGLASVVGSVRPWAMMGSRPKS